MPQRLELLLAGVVIVAGIMHAGVDVHPTMDRQRLEHVPDQVGAQRAQPVGPPGRVEDAGRPAAQIDCHERQRRPCGPRERCLDAAV